MTYESNYLKEFNAQLSRIQNSIQKVNARQKGFEVERKQAESRWKKIEELKRKVGKLRSMKQINLLMKRSEIKKMHISKLEEGCERKAELVDDMKARVADLKNEILLQTRELKDNVDNLEIEQQRVKDQINIAIEKETKVEKIEKEISRVKLNISGLEKFVELEQEKQMNSVKNADIDDRITRLRKHRDELKRQKNEMDLRCNAQTIQFEHFLTAQNRELNELKRNTNASRTKVHQFIGNPRTFFDDEQKAENWSEETSGGVSSEVSHSYGHSEPSVQNPPDHLHQEGIASVSVSASISQFHSESAFFESDLDDVEEVTGEYEQYLLDRSESITTFQSDSFFSPTANSQENYVPPARNGFNLISYSRSVTPGRYESGLETEDEPCDSPSLNDRERSIESSSIHSDEEVDEKYLFELSHAFRITSLSNVLDMFPPGIVECIILYFQDPISDISVHHWQFPYILTPSPEANSPWQLLLHNKMICGWEDSFTLGLPYIIRIQGCRLGWINANYVLFKPQEDQLGWIGFDHNESGYHPYIVFEDQWEVKVDKNCYYSNGHGFLKAKWSDNLGKVTKKMVLKIDRQFPALVEASSTENAI